MATQSPPSWNTQSPLLPSGVSENLSVRRTRTRTGTPFQANKRVKTPVFEGDGGRGEVLTPALSPSFRFGLSSGRHGSQCSNRAVGGQTPTHPLNPAKCACQSTRWSFRSGFLPMKDIIKSYGGTALVVVVTLVLLKIAAPYLPASVRNWLPV